MLRPLTLLGALATACLSYEPLPMPTARIDGIGPMKLKSEFVRKV
jgi:hypothetical protein